MKFLIFFSEKEIERIAKEEKLVVRKSSITGFKFLLTFTNGLLNENESTLTQLAAYLNNNCDAEVSPQAIDQRIGDAAEEFMRICFIKSIQLSMKEIELDSEIMKMFNHIFIIDSSNFALHPKLADIFKGNGGSASKSSLRIQFMYDFLSGQMFVQVGDVKLADATALYNILEENKLKIKGTALFLADLGYFKINSFILINESSNKFVSRLKHKVLLYNEAGKLIDIPKLFEGQQEVNIEVRIGNLRCRLIGKKLPEDIVNKRLRSANNDAKKRGKTVTDEQKTFLKYGLYITNIECNITFNDVFTLYRIRWQIELIFKTWKSILGMHKIRTAKENRVMCEVYGKLIIAALTSYFYYAIRIEYNLVISYHKMLQYIKSLAVNWTICILKGKEYHKEFLLNLTPQILRFCRKNKQENKPTIEFLLESLDVPENKLVRP